MKLTIKDIILIALVVLFFYLWVSKPNKLPDNSKQKIDSLNMVITKTNDSIEKIKMIKDSLLEVNFRYVQKINMLQKDKHALLDEYEKVKGHIISNTTSADLEYFTKHISKVDNRWK